MLATTESRIFLRRFIRIRYVALAQISDGRAKYQNKIQDNQSADEKSRSPIASRKKVKKHSEESRITSAKHKFLGQMNVKCVLGQPAKKKDVLTPTEKSSGAGYIWQLAEAK
jgi:hypothetical protein